MELLTAAASSAQYDIDNIVPILFMPVLFSPRKIYHTFTD